MSYDRKANLRLDRLLKGCYNCFNNPTSHASSLKNTLREIKEYDIDLKEDINNLFNLGLEKKRPDLILTLFNKSTKDDFSEELNLDQMINYVFRTISCSKAGFLKKLLSCWWAKEICPMEIYNVLIFKISHGLLSNNPNLLTLNDRQRYYKNFHIKKSQEVLTYHPICADVLTFITEKEINFYKRIKFYYKNNPELKRRTKARWTIIFFFAKYVKNSIRHWVWMPGGPMFKRGLKRWLINQTELTV